MTKEQIKEILENITPHTIQQAEIVEEYIFIRKQQKVKINPPDNPSRMFLLSMAYQSAKHWLNENNYGTNEKT